MYATQENGLTLWRPNPRKDLPNHLWPIVTPESYTINIPLASKNYKQAYCIKDSNWASDLISHRSVGGTVIILAGASVIYKTFIQRVVALSSTEAEFYALAEAGKMTLYLRLVLADLNFEQMDPTTVLKITVLVSI